jgi:hypothetical protein
MKQRRRHAADGDWDVLSRWIRIVTYMMLSAAPFLFRYKVSSGGAMADAEG